MEANLNTTEILNGKVISIPIIDKTLTKDGYAADAKITGEAIEKMIKKVDIVDDLTTENPNKPLSAKQGALLKQELDNLKESEAGGVGYDNTSSGLKAENMQGAIDELASDKYSKNGGMIEGTLSVRNAANGYGSLNKNNSASADYGTQVVDRTQDGKTAYATICAALGTFTFTDPDGNIRDVHHEGTKPFGSYQGNGDATDRVIDTKGIGRLIVIYNIHHFSFVTPEGALVIKLSDGSISWIDSGKVYYLNGKIYLGLTNVAFNENGTTYHYQAI